MDYLLYLRHLFAYKFASVKLSMSDVVLDVGCGEGYGTYLLSHYARKIIGLDVDKDIIKHASKKYGNSNCIFRVYDGRRIPYPNETFNVVVSFQVIEHVVDDLNFVLECFRVLKKGGFLFLTTPNKANRLKPNQKPWNPFHVREYYPHELKSILEKVFPEVKLLGIHGDTIIRKIEVERVRRAQLFTPLSRILNFLILRMSRILKKLIIDTLLMYDHAIYHKNSELRREFRLTLTNFTIKNDVENALDILAICRKL